MTNPDTTPDLVARLDESPSRAAHEAAAAIRARDARIKVLEKALNKALIGGNHLGTHIDMEGPQWRDSHDKALAYYGAGLPYDAWCCWKSLMEISAALSAEPEEEK
jgi:hypothetical protein